MSQSFTEEDIQMAKKKKKHVKRCSVWSAIR